MTVFMDSTIVLIARIKYLREVLTSSRRNSVGRNWRDFCAVLKYLQIGFNDRLRSSCGFFLDFFVNRFVELDVNLDYMRSLSVSRKQDVEIYEFECQMAKGVLVMEIFQEILI